MADDIVARLREPASSHGLHVFDPTHETRKAAADEIERLRAENEQLKRVVVEVVNEAREQIAKARAALAGAKTDAR